MEKIQEIKCENKIYKVRVKGNYKHEIGIINGCVREGNFTELYCENNLIYKDEIEYNGIIYKKENYNKIYNYTWSFHYGVLKGCFMTDDLKNIIILTLGSIEERNFLKW